MAELITDGRLLTLIDLPVSLPQVSLPPGAWLAVASVRLNAGELLDWRWLQLLVAGVEALPGDQCGSTGAEINVEFQPGSLAAVFLVRDWSPSVAPYRQVVLDSMAAPTNFEDIASVSYPLMVARAGTPLQLVDPGDYTVVVLNNSTNKNVAVTVAGALTLDLEPML